MQRNKFNAFLIWSCPNDTILRGLFIERFIMVSPYFAINDFFVPILFLIKIMD